MKTTQEIVNVIDGEGAARWWKRLLVFLLVVSFFVYYDLQKYKNFSNPVSMDMAQLAQNIADGRGYVTDNIRISSAMIVAAKNNGDPRLQRNHPDIVNPPVYPAILAGLFKIIPVGNISSGNSFRILPEMVICFFNQFLLVLTTILIFFLGWRLFDLEVGMFAAFMFFLNDMIWKFSVSGLPTLLSITIILLLFWVLISFRMRNIVEDINDVPPVPSVWWTIGKTALAGFLLGVACLTQYALGWLVIPVVSFVMVTARNSRKLLAGVVVLLVFAVVVTPWITRNMQVSGLPFGLATYAPASGTETLPKDTLDRVTTADILAHYGPEFWEYKVKFTTNTADIFQNEVPRIGGTWLTICFVAGILLPFMRRGLNSSRCLVIAGILLMVFVEAMVRTHLSKDCPTINSENLLIVFLPMIVLFGSAFIFTMIEEINYGLPLIRKMIIWACGAVLSLPMIFTLLPPPADVMAYPPYYPQVITKTGSLFKSQEMIVTDMPWAMAWYGKHQAMNLPLNPKDEFFKINDGVISIRGVYLTQLTLDRRFLSEFNGSDKGWGDFVIQFFTRGELPPGFPLRSVLGDMLPSQMLLAEWERWKAPVSEEKD